MLKPKWIALGLALISSAAAFAEDEPRVTKMICEGDVLHELIQVGGPIQQVTPIQVIFETTHYSRSRSEEKVSVNLNPDVQGLDIQVGEVKRGKGGVVSTEIYDGDKLHFSAEFRQVNYGTLAEGPMRLTMKADAKSGRLRYTSIMTCHNE